MKIHPPGLAALSVSLTLALATLAVTAPPAAAELPELIPLEVLFDNPKQSQARLSPDGKYLSYLAPSDKGVLNVWIEPLGEGEPRMVTQDTDRGIRTHAWSEDGGMILYLQDIGGDENWHFYGTDLGTGVTRDLTPFLGIRAQNIVTDRNRPGEILVGLNLRDRRVFDMYRIDLATGAVVFDTANPGDVLGWVTDPDFRIRAAFATSPATGDQILRVRDSEEAEWRDLVTWPFDENGNVHGFSADGKSLFIESSLDTDTTRLLRIDASSGEELEVLAQHERSDVGSLFVDEARHLIQAVERNYLKPEWQILDPAIAPDFARLGEKNPGASFGVTSRTADDKKWIVFYDRDDAPTSYYLYDRDRRTIDLLFSTRPDLEKYTLAEMEPVIVPVRDGLELVSYLTLPVGVEAKGLPLVLNVHGGPWSRDVWEFERTAQWLANRGYAVLQVNFRGSTGFGKSFLNAGNGEWGQGFMQHDLTDAVKWAIDQGIADPERVAIMGGSYGGYATLAGLTFTPQVYTCGVDIVGMSNMQTTFATIPPYWAPFKRLMLMRVGDVEADAEYNRRISPLFHADKIRAPLLIGQGANDPRVNIAESNQIVEAMRKNEQPVTYVVYPDEGHGFARPENMLDFRYRADQFLAGCLEGRAQTFQEVEGTTAELH
jgi:dipeptidyl aminopeptidase/acylaminoacyl peptidase